MFFIKYLPFVVCLLFTAFTSKGQFNASTADSIRTALVYQKTNYPVSQYRDVYKNFMQDFFGPGHILSDVESSKNYLRRELAVTRNFEGPLFEPTGYRGNFYRVNLSLIADGTVPFDTFFNAFVNSVSNITPPDPTYWLALWNFIDEVIKDLGWTFENEEEDRTALAEQFGKGNFIAHHSAAYNEAVNFHYRIISRENFEKFIRPLINGK